MRRLKWGFLSDWRANIGNSHEEFVKYPRTPHLFGSKGTDDDKHMSAVESERFLAERSLVVEEKIDGTNVGIHFTSSGKMALQCRGHLITEGMHPQYDLFKQWAAVKRSVLEDRLQDRFILFGEWVYARHSIHYRRLPHYFFEFDIYDKVAREYLDLRHRLVLLEGLRIETVPVLHTGALSKEDLAGLIRQSRFDSRFEHPLTKHTDDLVEGLYLRTESNGRVVARAKWVRPEFVEKVKQSVHWQQQVLVPNLLKAEADIWL